MKPISRILAMYLLLLTSTGCLLKETTHTFYLEPDGAIVWRVVEKDVRSDAESVDERRREEAAAELEKANTLERSIAELGTTNQRNIEEQFRRAKSEIMDAILRVVREFNAEKGYAVVLDKSSASSNGLPQVLDAPGADDITAEIIAPLSLRVNQARFSPWSVPRSPWVMSGLLGVATTPPQLCDPIHSVPAGSVQVAV